MFGLLLSSAYPTVKVFTASHSALTGRRLGAQEAGTHDPSWPEGHSTPYGVLLSDKTGGSQLEVACLGTHWALFQWVVSNCIMHNFFLYSFIIVTVFPYFSVLLNCLSQLMTFTFISFSLPISLLGSEGAAGRCLAACRVKPINHHK